MFRSLLLLLFCLAVTAAPTAGASDASNAIIDEARDICRSFDNGVLEVGSGAVTSVDLTGDGNPDEVVDHGEFICSTALSLFCGTGGCSMTAIADGKPFEFLTKAWKVVDWDGQPILLLVVHGSECGGDNLRRCYRAEVWSENGFRSVGRE